MNSDDRRHEYERLVAMGREAPADPTPRQIMIARLITPSAWSRHAQEQIDWCTRHRLTHSQTHFGALHLLDRRLALLKAEEIIRMQERHDAGLPELMAFNAHEVSTRLKAEQFQLHLKKSPREYVSHHPADQVFFLKRADGIPDPQSAMDPSGAVTLTWHEEDKAAYLHIACDRTATIRLEPEDGAPVTLDLHGWRNRTPWILTAVTDWIYFGGPHPGDTMRGDGPDRINAA